MKKLVFLFVFFTCLSNGFSQTVLSKTAFVSFYSELEDITANNYSGISQLDTITGRLLFSFAIQSFMFENATMQKHFNEEGVMHSKEFPRAKFVGTITNHDAVNYAENGEYKINVSGDLTIKGTTKPIKTTGRLKVTNGKIEASATFTIDRYAFGVTGQQGAISQELKLTVNVHYE